MLEYLMRNMPEDRFREEALGLEASRGNSESLAVI